MNDDWLMTVFLLSAAGVALTYILSLIAEIIL